MDKKKITSVSNFIEIIEQFQSKNLLGQIYYRGQHNGLKQNWKLIPSFYRKKKTHERIPFYNDLNEELNSIYKFVEKNVDYFNNIDFSDIISILNILQHYGFPTRVLDVTNNPLVALYFALENIEPTDNPVVYLIKSNKCYSEYFTNQMLNDFYYEEKVKDKVVMVNGSVLSDRIKNQKGDFILFFEEEDIHSIENFRIEEISIEKAALKKIKKELDILGINKSTIYPSLEEESTKFTALLDNSEEEFIKMAKYFNFGINKANNVIKNDLNKNRKYLKKPGAIATINTKNRKRK